MEAIALNEDFLLFINRLKDVANINFDVPVSEISKNSKEFMGKTKTKWF